MRRSTSVLAVGLLAFAISLLFGRVAGADSDCDTDDAGWFCQVSEPPSGGPVVGPPVEEPPEPPPPPSLQFLYTGIDPTTGGDCSYWSSVPGGLDAWGEAN